MRHSSPFGAYFGPSLGGVRRIPIRRTFMGQDLVANPQPTPGVESQDNSCVHLTTVKNPGMITSTITERYITRGFNILRVPIGTAYDMPATETETPSKGGSFQMYELWACQPGHTPPGYQEPGGKTSVVVSPPPTASSKESAPPSGDVADVAVAGGLLAAVAAVLLVA